MEIKTFTFDEDTNELVEVTGKKQKSAPKQKQSLIESLKEQIVSGHISPDAQNMVTLKIPGVSAPALSAADLTAIANSVESAQPTESTLSPSEVFASTLEVDSETGEIRGQLSMAPRSRAVRIPSSERADFVKYLRGIATLLNDAETSETPSEE